MARNPGDEDSARFIGDDYYITVNDVNLARFNPEYMVSTVPYLSATYSVPVLSGANANSTLTLSASQTVVVIDNGSTEIGVRLPPAFSVIGRTYTIKKAGGSAAILVSGSTAGEKVDNWTFVTLTSISSSLSVTAVASASWAVTGFLTGSRGANY